jgi:hypothetical protein
MLLCLDRAKATIRYDISVKSIRKSAPGELWQKIKTTHSKLQLTLCDLIAPDRSLFPYIIVIKVSTVGCSTCGLSLSTAAVWVLPASDQIDFEDEEYL